MRMGRKGMGMRMGGKGMGMRMGRKGTGMRMGGKGMGMRMGGEENWDKDMHTRVLCRAEHSLFRCYAVQNCSNVSKNWTACSGIIRH